MKRRSRKDIRFGVVVFPGSCDDHDVYHALSSVMGVPTTFVWHKEASLEGLDALVLPGGFSYGDYLRCGAMAKFSPVMKAVRRFAEEGGLVLGICNGFQILCEAGLLPGVLVRNRLLRFICEPSQPLRVEHDGSPLTRRMRPGAVIRLPFKHGEGCYFTDEATLASLETNGQILFRYATPDGKVDETANPNGSLLNIAGITNARGNVFGLMPHPEHAVEPLLGGTDGRLLFESMVDHLLAGEARAGAGVPPPAEAASPAETPGPAAVQADEPAPPDEPPVTAEAVERHGLSPEEHERILRILGREPNMTELGIFSVMWSEHCSYKSSRNHLRKLPTSGPRVLQGPGENAGVVDIGEGYAVAFKMESHNHPSFIEPYQGAATGVGGILRDVFTMGARPIASLDSLRFGSLDDAWQRHLVDGVVRGIGGYGNSFGCPTVGGETAFHPSYNGNILVNAFNLGLVRSDRIFRAAAAGVGNPVIYVGSRTGRDGIHGATMASEEFGEGDEQKRPTVQVGDPFAEKLLLEACLEVMKQDLVVSIQDMGAAGLTSSSIEMASRGDVGVEIDLSRVPLRETGMTPYEIMLSESQERMLLVAKRGREEEVAAIFRKWDLQVEVVGRVTDDGKLRLLQGGRVVGEIPVKPLAAEAPRYDRPVRRPDWQDRVQAFEPEEVAPPRDLGRTLIQLIGSPNLASKAWVYRQYDSLVRANTLQGPGGDAAVIRIKKTRKAIALTVECNNRFCFLDPRLGAALTVAEAARNLSCVGATPLAVTDCLNFGNPEKPEIMWQFAEAVEGMAEACRALDTPVVSGNVSFYNETRGTAIHPTPTVAMVGLLEDHSAFATPGWKEAGDQIALLGEPGNELGGSEYLAQVHGIERGRPPRLDWPREKAVQAACRAGIQEGLFRSAHDCAEGGLAVALAEACLWASGEGLGADVRLPEEGRPDGILFGESASRILVSFRAEDRSRVEAVAKRANAPLLPIGEVGGDRLRVNGWIDQPLSDLREAWTTGFSAALREKGGGGTLARGGGGG